MANDWQVLVDSLFNKGFNVEVVQEDNGHYGVAIMLDGGCKERPDGEDVESWQKIVDDLRSAAGVRDRQINGPWTGTVVK